MKKVFINANGYTMDAAEHRFEAVAVEDGLITCVGTNEAVQEAAGTACQIIDLQGKTVLPGFNDSHLHLLSYGYSLEVADLNDCRSLDELKDRLRRYIKENGIKPGQWVEAVSYTHLRAHETS